MSDSSFAGQPRYHAVSIAFHWTIAVLIIVNLAIGLLHETLLKGTIPLHKAIGMIVLVLSIARVVWRLGHRPPPLPAHVPAWERGIAHGVHWLLYALMIAMPATGWIFTSASDKPRPVSFGLFAIPPLPIRGSPVGEPAYTAHGVLGWVLLALVVLHILAALRHRFVKHDGVLARMLPGG